MQQQCGLLIPRREQNQPGEGRSSLSNNCWLALHRFLQIFFVQWIGNRKDSKFFCIQLLTSVILPQSDNYLKTAHRNMQLNPKVIPHKISPKEREYLLSVLPALKFPARTDTIINLTKSRSRMPGRHWCLIYRFFDPAL